MNQLLSPEAKRTVSTMLNGTLRVTVKQLLQQGMSPEDVAQALEVSEDLVTIEAEKLKAKQELNSTNNGNDSSQAPDPQNIIRAEKGLAELQDRAIEVVGELLEMADSSTVRLSAARMILEGANGSLRPKQQSTGTTNVQFNMLLQQAGDIYREQLERIKKPDTGTVIEVRPEN